jgi:hypothetical protein
MRQFINNIFTARDNVTFSMTKLLGMSGGFSMVWKFIQAPSPDYQAFGLGLAGIMAALAAKYYTEGKQ